MYSGAHSSPKILVSKIADKENEFGIFAQRVVVLIAESIPF
ncbi:hypothetical protein ACWIUD_01495 [Helicobacter sp. 23-1044]